MQDLDPTQYDEADAGGRRRAGRLLAREKHCRSWLSKIICGVIFYDSLGKSRCSGSGAPPLTPTRGGHTFEPSFAHREQALGSSSGTP
jgi:hypothetical protein